ncbi:MAG: hypothetical protein NTX59_08740 [Elusimicrobia bacterium]|nr:hypothetical protein [Elusimicrobiota bacterium]
MHMKVKYAVFTALLCCLAAGTQVAAEQPTTDAVAVSTQPAVESAGTDRDPPLMEKVRALKEQMRKEFRKKRVSTPEEARLFRTKAVTLSIEYHNMLHRKSKIPLIGAQDFEIHELIYAHPRIAAHIFACELEIYKSTDAYDHKAQAESIYGDRVKAEADWTAAIEMAPETELLRHRGYLYFTQYKYDQAIADFTRAIKAGGVAPLYHSRAMAYYRKDDYSGAADDLEQFFKLNTDNEYSKSVSGSRICSGLRKHGFAVEGCAAPENGGKKK